MNYTEQVNVDHAQYLLALPDEYWAVHIFDTNELNQNGEGYSQADYIKNAKMWLKKVVQCKGTMKTTYRYSKQMGNQGRIYVRKFGVQSLQKDLRGFLCGEYYTDYDMVNAHIGILCDLKEKHFPEVTTKTLDTYNTNRAKCLSDFGVTKIEVLKLLNQEWPYKGGNTFLKAISHEFRQLQTLVWNSDAFATVPKAGVKVKNKKGSFINRVLCVCENKILQEAIAKVKHVHVPYFDGFFRVARDEAKIINMLNDNEYGIKWTTKPHSNKIQIDATLKFPDYKSDYSTVKEKFEETHFMVQQPVCYVREGLDDCGKRQIDVYVKRDFVDVVAPYQYVDEADGKTKDFFSTWIRDADRRVYHRRDFYPNPDLCPNNVYNLFTGFRSEYIESVEDRKDATPFLDFITDVVCDHDASASKYLLHYIADVFQNPDVRPDVAILLRGQKGVGKELIFQFIEAMMGSQYTFSTDEIDDVVGKYNEGVSKCLVLKLEEIEGATGHENDRKIKNFITEPEHSVGNKHVKKWTEKNRSRVLFMSNGLNPINITSDNRRFCVIKTGCRRQKEYYGRMWGLLKDRCFLDSLYSHLMDLELGGRLADWIPHTKAMQTNQEQNTNPLYKFLYEAFVAKPPLLAKSGYKEHCWRNKKDASVVYIASRDFCLMYELFLSENEYNDSYIQKINFKTVKALLKDLGIENVKKKRDHSTKQYYRFRKHDFEDNLRIKYDGDTHEIVDHAELIKN